MFWFDKHHPEALYIDNRAHTAEKLSNGQTFSVDPDEVVDFRAMPYPSRSFSLVVFDPPHLVGPGKGWMAKKYGGLSRETWRDDLRLGFEECFRVLKRNGVLIFKWNETDISLKEILSCIDRKPLFGHASGKAAKTHWITFMKL